MTERARTIFLGSGSFAVPIVSALLEHPSLDLAAVVTAPTRRGSRGRPTDPPVADWAAANGLTMLRPTRLRDQESLAAIADLRPDLLVLADYGQIVPTALLELPGHGALNLHPSLLPRHRGASPIAATILAADDETGVSLMRMDAGLDTGPVIALSRLPLFGDETAEQLEDELARLGARLLADTVNSWLAGRIEPRPQDPASATVTRPLRREDGLLDPNRSAVELERQIRAYQPWPGSFLETDAGRMIVWKAHPSRYRHPDGIGRLMRDTEGRLLLTAGDRMLDLAEVQLAGGRRMSGAELARGRPRLQVLMPQTAPPGSSA